MKSGEGRCGGADRKEGGEGGALQASGVRERQVREIGLRWEASWNVP